MSKTLDSALYCLSAVFTTLGTAYLGVPLYTVLCNTTGIGGTPKTNHASSTMLRPENMLPIPGLNRPVRIFFDSNTSGRLPWKFLPLQRVIKVQPGETALAFYNATNQSQETIVGISTYNIIPEKCAQYFNKIQCFCFEEQRLQPGENVDMPVFFYLDKEFATDPWMNDVDEIILSYTFFRSK